MATTSNPTPTRPPLRARLPSTNLAGAPLTPGSPRTPLLGRSISSQFNSPGSFRVEQEDHIVYELGARHLSVGFAGESRARCVHCFGPEDGRRVGDYRDSQPGYQRQRKRRKIEEGADEELEGWGEEFELFRNDLRNLDLGLVEDKLERAVRSVHTDYLQLDQKPRKAVLAIPSLLPTPLLEIALKVLFNHYAQPSSGMLLTMPLLACVSAGLRNALVVEVGWEETVVSAIGEYKEVAQRRSVRAGKMLTWEMARLLEEESRKQGLGEEGEVTFEYAEEVTQRMGWVRSRSDSGTSTVEHESVSMIKIPSPDPESHTSLKIPFTLFPNPAEMALFATSVTGNDDHDAPLPQLAYNTLLSLPLDLRALCVSRIVITGGLSHLPGLKGRLLQELEYLISTRGWDPVRSYGSATALHQRVLQERSANINTTQRQRQRHSQAQQPNGDNQVPLSPSKKPHQESIPHSDRIHDDIYDPISLKAEREASKGIVEPIKGVVRGVETLGAWAGASIIARLGVKGTKEVGREDFFKHGLRDIDV